MSRQSVVLIYVKKQLRRERELEFNLESFYALMYNQYLRDIQNDVKGRLSEI